MEGATLLLSIQLAPKLTSSISIYYSDTSVSTYLM